MSNRIERLLSIYPKPESPHIYTGLFAKPLSEREWSDRPNKYYDGVSYTRFADAYDVDLGMGLSLFTMFHGYCSYFADYFWYRNPDWTEVSMMRDSMLNPYIHTYCIKEVNGRTLFADARGITDDPETFFDDFTWGKDMYIKKTPRNERVKKNWFSQAYSRAYDHIYGHGITEILDKTV